MLQRPNPTAGQKCGKESSKKDPCNMCAQTGGGKLCHKCNVMYKYKCNKCGCEYIGETSQNFYSRDQKHMKKYNENSKESFMFNHQKECHRYTLAKPGKTRHKQWWISTVFHRTNME